MKILLDTHVWLWLQADPDRLSDDALERLRDSTNDLYLSAASGWEIAIKHALGKLPLPDPPERYVPSRLETSGVAALPVDMRHALRVSGLPPHHQDPFDRLLVAQAQLDDLRLMTVDPQMSLYEVEILPATI